MNHHINSLFFCLIALLSFKGISQTQNGSRKSLKPDEKLIEFTTNRFTFPNLHVTPDKKHIIFDVLGDIYQVPIEGGAAKVLLQDKNWKRAGKLSPDGKTLAYVSDEAGDFQVWTYNLETKRKQKYPIIESIHYPLYPYWGANGNLLIPSIEGLRSYNIKTGRGKIIRPAKREEGSIIHTVNQKMTVGKAGKKAFYQANDTLWAFDFDKKIDTSIEEYTEKRKASFIRINENNTLALYFSKDKNDFSQLNLNSWDLKNNQTKTIINLSEFGHNRTTLDYSFDFIDDQAIILDKEGQIVRLDIDTGDYSPIPIEVKIKKVITKPLHRKPQYIRDSLITASVLRNPVTKSGLDTIYFGAFGKLHTYSKTTGKIKEVFPEKDWFEVSPSLSPDGNFLAYTTWNDWEMGHLYIRELKTGKEFQITQNPGRYINPTWSPDGTKISFIADETEAKMGTGKLSPLANTTNYNLDLHQIKVFGERNKVLEKSQSDTIYRVQPLSVLPKRFYPIPVYDPDGNSLYLSMKKKDKDLAVYAQVDLKSKKIINEYPIPFQTDEVLLSPDAKHIAFIFENRVYVDSFPFTTKLKHAPNSEFLNKKAFFGKGYVVEVLLPEARPIYEIAPSYLSWQNRNTLTWGSAEEIYQYNISSEKTAKIADIKVQKKRAISKTQYALTNVRIITIDKRDRIIEKGTILVRNNRIEKVGSSERIIIPKNYKVFDLNGKTIIPGLIDVHAHYHSLGPFELLRQQNHEYIGSLAYGVTTIYDPSVNILDYREQAQMVETGDLLGPRIFASGNIILSQPGPHEYDYNRLDYLEEAFRLTRSIKKLGVHGPIKEYLVKNSQKRKRLWKAAKKEKLTITTHQSNLSRALSRIINGYTAIEHAIGEFPLQKDITNLVGQSKIAYTPTYIVSPGIRYIYDEPSVIEKYKLLQFNGKHLYHNRYKFTHEYHYKKKQKIAQSRDVSVINHHNRETVNLLNILKVGKNISVGGHGAPLPGIGTHWELWFMTKGMSNYQALQAATINGAKKIDLQEEIGSIEKGKLADLVILNSNPLDNIFNTTDILYTVQNGNIYKADSMKQIYPSKKELKPWGWESPSILQSMENIYQK